MREDGLALSILFQAIAAGLIALVFVISAMGQYSAIHGLMGAVEGRSRAGVDEAGDVSGTVLKVLYFVAIAYTAWFITSIILTRLAITKHIQRR
jgi:hypothetical protein